MSEPDAPPDVDEPVPRVPVEPEVVESEPEPVDGLPYSELLPDGVDVRPLLSSLELDEQAASASAPTRSKMVGNFLFMVSSFEFQLFGIATPKYRAAAHGVTRAKTRSERKKFTERAVGRTLILSKYGPR